MNAPMSDARLTEIRAMLEVAAGPEYWSLDRADLTDAIRGLLGEVDHLRVDNARLRALVADELSRLGQELEQGGGALWDCPDSPSRGQRAHHFGNPKEQWTECLNGCGMTWARLQEASS